MSADLRRVIEAETLREHADSLHRMALIGGSPALTEALACVAKHTRTVADGILSGQRPTLSTTPIPDGAS